MTPRLNTDCAKNYCNRTLIGKVIVENVVTCFFYGTQYIHRWKVHIGLQFLRWQYGYIFICLSVIASKIWEMRRNSNRIWPSSSSRSSKVIDLGVNGKPICDFLIVNNCNFSVSATIFEIFTLEDRKLLISHTPPLFDAPDQGETLRISAWNLSCKNWRDGTTVCWKIAWS